MDFMSRARRANVRTAFAAALIGGVLGSAAVLYADPLGSQGNRADDAAREATAVMLCIQRTAFGGRAIQVQTDAAAAGGLDKLSKNERNLAAVLVKGIADMEQAQADLGVSCGEVDQPPPPVPDEGAVAP